MRVIIPILLLFSLTNQMSGQLIHELKTDFFNISQVDFQPNYEIISTKKNVGFEISTGFNFRDAILRYPSDPNSIETDVRERFKKRAFSSAMIFKFYFNQEINTNKLDYFVGPYIEFQKSTFYEPSFYEKQDELSEVYNWFTPNFLGQREIRPGVIGGVKHVTKSNIIIEMGIKAGRLFQENGLNNFEYQNGHFYINPSIKLGYRFGRKSNLETVG